jgi:hypothetical protein
MVEEGVKFAVVIALLVASCRRLISVPEKLTVPLCTSHARARNRYSPFMLNEPGDQETFVF